MQFLLAVQSMDCVSGSEELYAWKDLSPHKGQPSLLPVHPAPVLVDASEIIEHCANFLADVCPVIFRGDGSKKLPEQNPPRIPRGMKQNSPTLRLWELRVPKTEVFISRGAESRLLFVGRDLVSLVLSASSSPSERRWRCIGLQRVLKHALACASGHLVLTLPEKKRAHDT